MKRPQWVRFLMCTILLLLLGANNQAYGTDSWDLFTGVGPNVPPTHDWVRWRDDVPLNANYDDTTGATGWQAVGDGTDGWKTVFGIHSVLAYDWTTGKETVVMWGNNAMSYWRRDGGGNPYVNYNNQYTPFLIWDLRDSLASGMATYDVSHYGSVNFLLDPEPSNPGALDGNQEAATDPDSANLFCAGHSFLPDGLVLAAGGHYVNSARTNPQWYYGLKRGFLYDPTASNGSGSGLKGKWTILDDEMSEPRWYPTQVALPDGRVMVVGGVQRDHTSSSNPNYVPTTTYDILSQDPNWTTNDPLSKKYLFNESSIPSGFPYNITIGGIYPRAHLISYPAGNTSAYPAIRVIVAGPYRQILSWNPGMMNWDTDAVTTWKWLAWGHGKLPDPNVTPSTSQIYAQNLRSPNFEFITREGDQALTTQSTYAPERASGTTVLLPTTLQSVRDATQNQNNNNYLNPTSYAEQALYRLLLLGGRDENNDVQATAEIIDFKKFYNGDPSRVNIGYMDEKARWRLPVVMTDAREHMYGIVLPNGKVVCFGGQKNVRTPADATLATDIFDPDTNTFTRVADTYPDLTDDPELDSFAKLGQRTYHSSGLLLPTGQVLAVGTLQEEDTGGKYYNPQPEIYTPDYISGNRPIITGVSNAVNATLDNGGRRFKVDFTLPQSRSLKSVVLMRPGSATHSCSMDQMLVRLHFRDWREGVNCSPSPSARLVYPPFKSCCAPPGWYMLFVVDDQDSYSEAKWIQLLLPSEATGLTGVGNACDPETEEEYLSGGGGDQ